jgi:CDP-glucose 4,6-dehydratase
VSMSFWRDKKVFLTGHTGFKGAWLAKMLLHQGARVFGYSLYPATEPSLYASSPILRSIPQVIGDIRSSLELHQACRSFEPDIVLHLAAQALVRDSYANPTETFETNVMGTLHLFEAVRKTKSVKSLVNVTSDKCYENREWLWGYRENEPMGGKDPYSASKGCSELLTQSYRASFFSEANSARLSSARAGNVFGGGDWAKDRLIPDLIRAWGHGQPAQIRHPAALRPWQHVLEPVFGYSMLAKANFEKAGFDSGWNFGPNEMDAQNVGSVVEAMAKLWGETAQVQIEPAASNLKEAHLLRLDSSKAKSELGWVPVLGLSQGLKWTVQWYKNYNSKPSSADQMVDEQIETYLQRQKESGNGSLQVL